jgi:S-DNA-T family DNA segregation ATPase FtsK/SpoIIIE
MLEHVGIGPVSGGGFLGYILCDMGKTYLHSGALIVLAFFFLLGIQLCSGLSWKEFGRRCSRLVGQAGSVMISLVQFSGQGLKTQDVHQHKAKKDEVPSRRSERSEEQRKSNKSKSSLTSSSGPFSEKDKARSTSQPTSTVSSSASSASESLVYPPVKILSELPKNSNDISENELQRLSQKLTESLLEFGVQGEVVHIRTGPVVTMFEYRPAAGVKISRIAGLNDDLALALKASPVRVEAPIPGKDTVGVEIPNPHRQTVQFRDIIESQAFQNTQARLPMALGQNIQGEPQVEDLTKMPHLLVAGATGAGKSVCLNTIIISLLYKVSPEQMKLLLIDPKRIEMASYLDLPHLVHPVVTEMDQAKTALDWAVYEMESRYQAMAQWSVRHIDAYNKKVAEFQKNGSMAQEEIPEPFPYLIIIIDELADLMFTAGKEVEASIVRLAQLARASGIHIILATQRPSVDVVTGLIKANFPARISFQVTSKHDSRTILDTVGAQYLLGKGDMLFKTNAGQMKRVHGAYISDEDIASVIDFWKSTVPVEYEIDLASWKNELNAQNNKGAGNDDISEDPLYDQAVNFVYEHEKASISMIQRQLRIGFNRAARFVEQMEKDGIIGPQEGSKPRRIIKT